MNKRTLLWLSLGAIAVLILDGILAFAGNECLGSTLNLIGFLLSFVAWILGIILAARASQWGWLILIVFFTPLATMLYGLIGGRD